MNWVLAFVEELQNILGKIVHKIGDFGKKKLKKNKVDVNTDFQLITDLNICGKRLPDEEERLKNEVTSHELVKNEQ